MPLATLERPSDTGVTAPSRSVWAAARPVARHALPAVAVATLIPMGLFYLVMALATVHVAILTSVAYAYSAGAWQYRRRRRVSGMLLLTMFMATVRAVAALVWGHAFVYFAVPVVETAGFGLLFLASMAWREPLVVRLARDFVPHLADGVAARRSLVRTLSLIWAVTYLASGATTMVLLTTQPITVYLGAHQLAGWLWTSAGIISSVLVCRWRSRPLYADALRARPAFA